MKIKVNIPGLIITVVLVAAVILLVRNQPKNTFTFRLESGHEWSEVSYVLLKGNNSKFSAEIVDGKKLKVVNDSDDETEAYITVTEADGISMTYSLVLYWEYDMTNESSYMESDFELAE